VFNALVHADRALFEWLNGWAGHVAILDDLLRGLANDYFLIIGFCLVLVVLWFGTRDAVQRKINQTAVIVAAISLGIAQALVDILNVFFFRPRPFTLLPTHLLFYAPHDSSFPSNAATVGFAIAFGVFFVNRRAGGILLAMAVVLAFARVYVGVHYPSDVLGAAALAALTAWVISAIVKNRRAWVRRLLDFLEQFELA
jgi:undecaprenyl-diphosphatase